MTHSNAAHCLPPPPEVAAQLPPVGNPSGQLDGLSPSPAYSVKATWPIRITSALYAATLRLGALAGPVFGRRSPKISAATSGHALTTSTQARRAEQRRLALLVKREILIAEIQTRRHQHKATWAFEAALRRTTNELLQLELTSKETQ